MLLGRGETQPPAEADRSPVELPEDRPVIGDDVRALRISVGFRGYRMTEVDWLLDQFASVLDERDAELATLRTELARRPVPDVDVAADVDVDVDQATDPGITVPVEAADRRPEERDA